ncbi:prolow-density lipoprotein receptor-related protein 1-like [Garra rufa]|uniref:prolow-density lipoprotein receptor-related protein 1-like n=1 Tax=Garra rufa TaxID=137080 RepID=UPI003CCEBF2E
MHFSKRHHSDDMKIAERDGVNITSPPAHAELNPTQQIQTTYMSTGMCPHNRVSRCPPNEHQCLGSDLCVHMSKLCNGVPDCTDGGDEGPHCRELALNCTLTGCQDNCAVTRTGPMCYCKSGYEISQDGKTCKDFDECTVYGTCSQTCTNTDGSYTCSCVEGYLVQPDNRSCKAKNVPVDRLPVLLIANSQNIQITSLSGSSSPSLYITTKQTTAMDFLYAQETVCWINVGDSPAGTRLKCAKITGLKSFTDERTINISLSLHLCHFSDNLRQMGLVLFIEEMSEIPNGENEWEEYFQKATGKGGDTFGVNFLPVKDNTKLETMYQKRRKTQRAKESNNSTELQVKWEKSKLSPVQSISVLGMELDSSHEQARPVSAELPQVIQRKSNGPTETISGHMASLAVVTVLGLMHMRLLQH